MRPILIIVAQLAMFVVAFWSMRLLLVVSIQLFDRISALSVNTFIHWTNRAKCALATDKETALTPDEFLHVISVLSFTEAWREGAQNDFISLLNTKSGLIYYLAHEHDDCHRYLHDAGLYDLFTNSLESFIVDLLESVPRAFLHYRNRAGNTPMIMALRQGSVFVVEQLNFRNVATDFRYEKVDQDIRSTIRRLKAKKAI